MEVFEFSRINNQERPKAKAAGRFFMPAIGRLAHPGRPDGRFLNLLDRMKTSSPIGKTAG